MTQIKLLLLDKDGTLTTPKSGKEFVRRGYYFRIIRDRVY